MPGVRGGSATAASRSQEIAAARQALHLVQSTVTAQIGAAVAMNMGYELRAC